MNVNKVISEIAKTRKLLPVAAYHPSAVPSIQLSDEKFRLAKPFLKQLFRAFGKHRFELTTSRWGELHVYSARLKLAITIRVTEETLAEITGIREFDGEEFGYRLFSVSNKPQPFVLRYCFTKTRSKWRSVKFIPDDAMLDENIAKALSEILKLGVQFEGRVSQTSDFHKTELSVQDIHALALFATRHVSSVQAWKGIHRICSQSFVDGFEFIDGGIKIEAKLPNSEHSFFWQKPDLSFNKRYLSHLVTDNL